MSMTVLEFPLVEIAIFVFLLVATIAAIKIGVSFDINAWLKLRHKRNKERFKITCPHTEAEMKQDERIEFQSLFHSPPGTVDAYDQAERYSSHATISVR